MVSRPETNADAFTLTEGGKKLGNLVKRESYRRMPVESKLDVLFDQGEEICDTLNKCKEQHAQVDQTQDGRIGALETRRKVDTAKSTGGGVVGGFAAMLLRLFFWRD